MLIARFTGKNTPIVQKHLSTPAPVPIRMNTYHVLCSQRQNDSDIIFYQKPFY